MFAASGQRLNAALLASILAHIAEEKHPRFAKAVAEACRPQQRMTPCIVGPS